MSSANAGTRPEHPLQRPGTRASETHVRTEVAGIPLEGAHSGFSHIIPSTDFLINPTTGSRYGANIGTGIYDSNTHMSHLTHSIRNSDFKRTAPESGKGIHAQQYRGRESGSVPKYVLDTMEISHHVDPHVNARLVQLEADQNSWESRFIQEKKDRAREVEGEMENKRRYERELQQERAEALVTEQERAKRVSYAE